MKRGTRREFLRTAGFVIAGLGGLAPLGSPRLYSQPSALLAEVQHVSAFLGPFLLRQLKVGRRLDVVWVRNTPCVALSGHLLGLLAPNDYQIREQAVHEKPAGARLARIDKNAEGRLLLFVQLIP